MKKKESKKERKRKKLIYHTKLTKFRISSAT